MKYCRNCGKELNEKMKFCPKCGTACEINYRSTNNNEYHHNRYDNSYYRGDYRQPYEAYHRSAYNEEFSLSCVLAYIPGLFWAPLLSKNKDERHKGCANQGLILTIIFVVISLILVFLWPNLVGSGVFDSKFIAGLYTNWTVLNWPGKMGNVMLMQLLVILFAYVPVNVMCGFFNQFHSHREYVLPIFGRIRIFK